jgi:alanyl-tRNA synthetase
MNHRELRRTFLEFYAKRDHKVVSSMSLIPRDDPTMLFTSAGMVQFKPLWAGTVGLPYRRACSVQKCLRASDLDQVGRTARHLTFFEMLGNFSFGDYFKYEAIPWAWEYVTEVVKLDRDRLWATVFEQDDEAYNIWRTRVGLPESRIVRLGAKDNFWGPVGGGGACGPCSEIYLDLGQEYGCGQKDCKPGCDCDRYTEFYNIVFPQFNQMPDGTREPLKNRGIDTGMGLERLAMMAQGKRSVFESDLFVPLAKATAKVLGMELNESTQRMLRIAADHARALTFAIADGVIPSNEARGYVLRNILRRALLFAHRAGVHEPFMYRVAGEVAQLMGQWYAELEAKREQTALIIKAEEERFLRTLEAGLERWAETAERFRRDGIVPGDELFKLHDTFGFHVELVGELATDAGLRLDTEGFEKAMAEQRERSKKATFIDTGALAGDTGGVAKARFVGYDSDETETKLLRVQPDPKDPKLFELYLEDSPFYAEMGGQVGDTGKVTGEGFEFEVLDTVNKAGLRVSKARLVRGTAVPGPVRAVVNVERRREIERAHTATHLLHAALRRVLGDYVKQEGSLVEPGRLRFDFHAFEPMKPEQVVAVERLVYDQVVADIPLARAEKSLDEAKAEGALAFFGDTYGERVTVVSIGQFSKELCGGTHLRSTGEIGLFRIVSETGVAAGIRRIEALAGKAAFECAASERATVTELLGQLGGTEDTLVKKVAGLTEDLKRLDARVRALSTQLARGTADELAAKSEPIGGVNTVAAHLAQFEGDELRVVADRLRELLAQPYAGFLTGGVSGDRLRYVVFVSSDLKDRLPAGKLAKSLGGAMGGGGGGKPDIAEGGGRLDKLTDGQAAFRTALSA